MRNVCPGEHVRRAGKPFSSENDMPVRRAVPPALAPVPSPSPRGPRPPPGIESRSAGMGVPLDRDGSVEWGTVERGIFVPLFLETRSIKKAKANQQPPKFLVKFPAHHLRFRIRSSRAPLPPSLLNFAVVRVTCRSTKSIRWNTQQMITMWEK
ncbi:hypothetical protein NL676_007739 [Syzygium grande]|nr:hypothetical protein NL676_007739 [Syzygium grande]